MSSGWMSLEAAIEHAESVARAHPPGTLCEQEHDQLSKWLTELRVRRSEDEQLREDCYCHFDHE